MTLGFLLTGVRNWRGQESGSFQSPGFSSPGVQSHHAVNTKPEKQALARTLQHKEKPLD